MKRSLIYFLSLTLVAGSIVGFTRESARPNDRQIVRVIFNNYRAEMARVNQLGLDLAGIDLKEKTADFVVNESEMKLLQSKGFKIQVVKSATEMKAPDSKYFTADKLNAALRTLVTQYPNLAQMQSVGKSLEGRDIFAVKITNNVKQNAVKPTILFNGMHHAREVMSVEVPFDIIQYLLTNYGKNAEVTQWVNTTEIWVLPMFNVDGNNIVWTRDEMWRKNAHGGYGVDINRNYPYNWNSCNGSSGRTNAQDYRGPNAGSEPETQVMMNLVRTIRPVFDISYHAYSEIVIYPYGCPGQNPDDAQLLQTIGREIAASIVTDRGNGRYVAGTAPDLLYPVDGDDLSWMYHEYHVLPFVIELNSSSAGFQPSYAKLRDLTVTNNRPGWQLLLRKMQTPAIRERAMKLKNNQRP